MNNKITLDQLYLQKEHIMLNNKDDDNYEDQLKYIEKQIEDFKNNEYYSNLIYNDFNIRKLYSYNGPIYYNFNNYLGKSGEYTTCAQSKKEAIRNIKFRIKNNLGKTNNFIIYLDEKYLTVKE